jgi:hypothetical protein
MSDAEPLTPERLAAPAKVEDRASHVRQNSD